MENSSYTPYVTERIRRFDGALIGTCYSASFMLNGQDSPILLNEHNIISRQNQSLDPVELIIIPLMGNILRHFLQEKETYSSLQAKHIRLAINYETLLLGGTALREAAQQFSFWLYDLATPNTRWSNITAFPFSGIVLTEEFFTDNYLKFSLPFLLSPFREREAEVILRTPALTLPVTQYAEIQLSGWQHQQIPGPVFVG